MRQKIMRKKLVFAMATLLMLVILPSLTSTAVTDVDDQYENPTMDQTSRSTHTVLAEYGTATWCGYCKYAHAALKNIYAAGTQDFQYISMVHDKNVHASARNNEYNIYGFPTVWFDGGYEVRVGAGSVSGAEAAYNSAIDSCENRPVYDIYAQLSVEWTGNAVMNIIVSIQNNESTPYHGHLHVYVTEIVSSMGWVDTWGYPYTFPFLDYAFNQDLTINAGDTWQASTTWDGHNHNDGHGSDFGGITMNNTMVILAVFNDTWHQGYSYPPSGNPFDAYYVDEVVTAIPSDQDLEPPEILNVQVTPTLQETGRNVNISADVTDNRDVDQVKAVITYPDGTVGNETMISGSGDLYYYNTTFTITGIYTVYIWAADGDNNQNTSSTYTFEIMDPYITTVSPNWNFIAIPFNQSLNKEDIIVKYNNIDYTWNDAVTMGLISDYLFGWDRTGQTYTFADTLEPGYGYWAYAYQSCEFWAPLMNANIDEHITDLKEKWNLIGCPDDDSFSKTDLTVTYLGMDYTWSDAVAAGIISDYIFNWDRTGQTYTFADTLEPGYSYWMYAYQECALEKP